MPGTILIPAASPVSRPRVRAGTSRQSATTIAASNRLICPSHSVRWTGSSARHRTLTGSALDQARPSRRAQVSMTWAKHTSDASESTRPAAPRPTRFAGTKTCAANGGKVNGRSGGGRCGAESYSERPSTSSAAARRYTSRSSSGQCQTLPSQRTDTNATASTAHCAVSRAVRRPDTSSPNRSECRALALPIHRWTLTVTTKHGSTQAGRASSTLRAQDVEGVLQVGRVGRRDGNPLTGRRMVEPELARVQPLAGQAEPPSEHRVGAVGEITHAWMADRGHVHADLVGAPRLEADVE